MPTEDKTKLQEDVLEDSKEEKIPTVQEPAENQPEAISEPIDYAKIVKEDIRTLSLEFPELKHLTDISELDNPLRYGALRDLGLTPQEAYLATSRRRRVQDNRAHLERTVPRGASAPPGAMSDKELCEARAIFSDITDAEIKRLYKKVTG